MPTPDRDRVAKSRSVLLVEDSSEVKEFVTEVLTRSGFSVVSVSDGQDAWQLLSTRDFDLVITDIGLPDIDGGKLLKNMRKNSIKTPVLLTSGVKIDAKERYGNLSDYRLIYKPFEIKEIKKAISGLLKL